MDMLEERTLLLGSEPVEHRLVRILAMMKLAPAQITKIPKIVERFDITVLVFFKSASRWLHSTRVWLYLPSRTRLMPGPLIHILSTRPVASMISSMYHRPRRVPMNHYD